MSHESGNMVCKHNHSMAQSLNSGRARLLVCCILRTRIPDVTSLWSVNRWSSILHAPDNIAPTQFPDATCALWEARLFIRPSLKSPGCLRRNGMAYTVYHLPFLNWLRCRDRQKPIIIITCAEVVRQQIIQTHAQECANIPKLLRNCRWNEQSEFLKLSVLHIQITMEPNWQFSANQVNHSWWPPFFEI